MKRSVLLLLLSAALAWNASPRAQDETGEAAAAEETETPEEAEAAVADEEKASPPAPAAAQEKVNEPAPGARTPDTFTPSEEISEDLSVPFPVDI